VVHFDARPALKLFLVRYHGAVTAAETEQGVAQAAACLTTLPGGFRLLADLSALTSMEVGCAPSIEKVMDLCQKQGVSEIVRIIPDPSRDIGMQIMSLFHYGGEVRIFTCSTQDEALRLLSTAEDLNLEEVRAALALGS
jgi:hypothetical protein